MEWEGERGREGEGDRGRLIEWGAREGGREGGGGEGGGRTVQVR